MLSQLVCLKLKQGRWQLKEGREAAGKGKRGGPPLNTGLAGALDKYTKELCPILTYHIQSNNHTVHSGFFSKMHGKLVVNIGTNVCTYQGYTLKAPYSSK